MVHISGCKDKGISLQIKTFALFFQKKSLEKRAVL